MAANTPEWIRVQTCLEDHEQAIVDLERAKVKERSTHAKLTEALRNLNPIATK